MYGKSWWKTDNFAFMLASQYNIHHPAIGGLPLALADLDWIASKN
jgi:hypothetical protein